MDRQKGITGIYKITNLTNNKCYIGQSRNISQRWKQHTSKLNEDNLKSRIRAALKKYNLSQIVYRPGVYGHFKFEIIETCREEELLSKEAEWIEKYKPEYNCTLLTSGEYYKGNYLNKDINECVQYHNYDVEGGYPSNDVLKMKEDFRLEDSHHYISSRKRSILYSQGDTIYLVVGKSINRKKLYFLWTKTIVEEIDFLEEEDLIYNAFGGQIFLHPPQLLNNHKGFDEFFKRTGNFGFGFQNISNYSFTKTLDKLSEKYKCINEDSISYKDYIISFEETYANGA